MLINNKLIYLQLIEKSFFNSREVLHFFKLQKYSRYRDLIYIKLAEFFTPEKNLPYNF